MTATLLKTYQTPTKNNTKLFGQELPKSSFVEYPAYKLRETEIYWVNKAMLSELGIDHQLGEQFLLEHFSYVTEDFAPETLLDMNDRKVFLADRYGSPGQVCNGGSARCG
ncbi:hypothetical protein JCM19240_3862 [Vibrio maritimus]|uniref:Uncharacterized protein n=1 Tax=Vibrio maritimus TaxID=990268 RepID=A0A090TAE5_9VIBR|nr:hypothetical protein JCM19240_3862 [Vibrio maritimus]